MLKTENEFKEKEGLAIWNPTQGVAYQIAGALNRLGSRMTALVFDSESDKKYRSLSLTTKVLDPQNPAQTAFEPHIPIETFLFCLDPWLSTPASEQEVPAAKESLQKAVSVFESLKNVFPSIKSLFVLPQAFMHQSQILEELHNVDTLLWTPLCFGFRDGFLFDQILETFNKNAALLEHPLPAKLSHPYIFAGDVAAMATTISMNNQFWGKHFYIPTEHKEIENFRKAFVETFADLSNTNWLERISAKLDNPVYTQLLEQYFSKALSTSEIAARTHNALEYFPTNLTSLDRAFSTLKRSYTRFKETELIFPPAQMP
jgi:hypothetical protein